MPLSQKHRQRVINWAYRTAGSNWFDLLGVAIVLVATISAGYYATTLAQSPIPWLHDSAWKCFPLGIVSTFSAVLSVLSTRYVGKINNLGNLIGFINIVIAGFVDYALGNFGAIYTYPISFILNMLAWFTWRTIFKNRKGNVPHAKIVMPLIAVLAVLVSFGINYFAFRQVNFLFIMTSLVFSFSLMADTLNVFKVKSQWTAWGVYNVLQLIRNITMGNWANVGKYIYYVLNSMISFVYWKLTGKTLAQVKESQ
ncbi:nicotinamide mononucleotide transporter family protein [Fructilactobacillus hinvesii]|uniref:Nicotinamide mononucleotide transporter family protein n=1 Tax=Fructilactobacillus hinvesii TaxID=2940300 RepID=A0ABY5BUC1_9LACO|nr:nicotinamide mononucleotide transporter family protein [Fructilactobacillus hinvesii]USS88250.1 nicotinamide mononucleotide transporter family protein [Fructilactobacillus hinvesii]